MPSCAHQKHITHTDYLIIESTYGNKHHDTSNPQDQIGDIINQTLKKHGTVVMPAFAVGRAQSLLYYIYQLKAAHKIPDVPVFLDSPMAINATEILSRFKSELKLDEKQCKHLCEAATYVNTPEQSKQLDAQTTPKIIISASGMAEGGRVLHHIRAYAPDPKNTILFTGYQASGTRGERIVAGTKEIKIYGEKVTVNARVEVITSTSHMQTIRKSLIGVATLVNAHQNVYRTWRD